ncbi:hypothetical protein [Actinomadura gamaensis]|uniref:Lipoprotein n=1 Tax=Actinomadura gamaensis TaxID=1763541 RepID=A0ABV9U977_9ACTN
MRCLRSIAATTAAASLLAACSTDHHPARFEPTPRPGRPGEAVVIAGEYRVNRDPKDGEFAVRSSAYSDGGLAVTAAGRPYFEVAFGEQGRIARIERDGRLTLLSLGELPDQLAADTGALWLLRSVGGLSLVRASLSDLTQTVYARWRSQGKPDLMKVTNHDGRPFGAAEQAALSRDWLGSKLVLRGDGVPILVNQKGALFEARGGGELRAWNSGDYVMALRAVTPTGGDFTVTAAGSDGRGGLVVVGRTGLIRVPREAPASAVPFPESARSQPPWTAVTSMQDGSLLLLGGVDASHRTPRPVLVRSDGSLLLLNWGGPKWCDQFDGTSAAVASAVPGGVGRLPNGDLVLSDKNCGRVYEFRPPSNMDGRPYR